jgi:hypothetical protein
MFDKIKNLFKKPEPLAPVVKEKKARIPKEKKVEPQLTDKERATQAGEPYVNVLKMEVDPTNIHEGSFELDWNEIFIAKLVKTGYMKSKEDTDRDIVDRWFQDVCRTIVLEMYDQVQADPSNRDGRDVRNVVTKDLGNGRTEVS